MTERILHDSADLTDADDLTAECAAAEVLLRLRIAEWEEARRG